MQVRVDSCDELLQRRCRKERQWPRVLTIRMQRPRPAIWTVLQIMFVECCYSSPPVVGAGGASAQCRGAAERKVVGHKHPTAAQGGSPTSILTILVYTGYTHYMRYASMTRGSLPPPARVAAGCSQTAGEPAESAITAAQGGSPTSILTILIYTDYTHYTRFVLRAERMFC